MDRVGSTGSFDNLFKNFINIPGPFHGLILMGLGFLRFGWARFELDISIQPIPLPFGPNSYLNAI